MKYETRTGIVIVLLASLFFLSSLCKRKKPSFILSTPLPTIIEEYEPEYEDIDESSLEFYCDVSYLDNPPEGCDELAEK